MPICMRSARLMRMAGLAAILAMALGGPARSAEARERTPDYRKDMDVALKELKKACGHFFKPKGIDWRKVSKEMKKAAKAVKTDEEHLVLMVRLLARLKDGHASVRPPTRDGELPWPDAWRQPQFSPGMYWCRIGTKIHVKVSGGPAEELGFHPGSEILEVDGENVDVWLDRRIETLRDRHSFSTDHQAFFFATHWGLCEPRGTRVKYTFRDPEGKKRTRTVEIARARPYVDGPAFPPDGVTRTKDLKHGRTARGFGYIHVRRCKGDLPAQMDKALAALGNVPGLILDFRGNSGGGFDHDAFFGRFIPAGRQIAFRKRYGSAGATPYGGPMVVIVDGTVVSAGETCSGMLKEDGRAYMIGESPTAGMSSQKKTIPLPSGLFHLYVSVHSNKARFNGGQGIEGVGIPPHETVPFDAEDLAAHKDTLIHRAEALLADWPEEGFPDDVVPYDPEAMGWASPSQAR